MTFVDLVYASTTEVYIIYSSQTVVYIINANRTAIYVSNLHKGYFSEAFLFKPLGTPTERFKQKAKDESFFFCL